MRSTSEAEGGIAGISVTCEDPRSAAARALMAGLEAEMRGRYPPESLHPFDPADLLGPRAGLLVAREGGEAVGCAGLREVDARSCELKRMVVLPAFRRRGYGRAILAAVEEAARGLGYARLVLETGLRQPEAVALYEGAGYRRIPAFGRYAEDPLALCFEKPLASAPCPS